MVAPPLFCNKLECRGRFIAAFSFFDSDSFEQEGRISLRGGYAVGSELEAWHRGDGGADQDAWLVRVLDHGGVEWLRYRLHHPRPGSWKWGDRGKATIAELQVIVDAVESAGTTEAAPRHPGPPSLAWAWRVVTEGGEDIEVAEEHEAWRQVAQFATREQMHERLNQASPDLALRVASWLLHHDTENCELLYGYLNDPRPVFFQSGCCGFTQPLGECLCEQLTEKREDPRVRSLLQRALDDETQSAPIRTTALVALASNSEADVAEQWERLLGSEDPALVAGALSGECLHDMDAGQLDALLTRMAEHPAQCVQEQVARASDKLPRARQTALLRTLLERSAHDYVKYLALCDICSARAHDVELLLRYAEHADRRIAERACAHLINDAPAAAARMLRRWIVDLDKHPEDLLKAFFGLYSETELQLRALPDLQPLSERKPLADELARALREDRGWEAEISGDPSRLLFRGDRIGAVRELLEAYAPTRKPAWRRWWPWSR